MARVPYEPVPTAQPQFQGEQLRVETPGAAFGENVGAALKQLGTSTDQVGNELFSRAIALQDLRNQDDARAAQTDYATKASELHAQFSALTGKAAADGLQGYLQSQKDLRLQIRGQLQSPMAARYYDADSLPFMQRNIFSAAGHAADQNKAYTVGTMKATADLNANSAGDDPYNEEFVEDKIAKNKEIVTNQTTIEAGITDANPESNPLVQDAVKNSTSKIRRNQILGIARTDPITAQSYIQKYNDQLTETDRTYVTGLVEAKAAGVGGTQVATTIVNKHRQSDGTYDVPLKQMQDEARDAVHALLPGNSVAADVAVGKIDQLQVMDRVADQRDKADAKNGLNDALVKYNPQDVQSLLAIPGMDKTVAMLPPEIKKDLQGYINRFNMSANKRTDEAALTMINGLRNNDSAQFMAIDPTADKYHLSQEHIRQVQNWQHQMSEKAYSDPRVSRAMTWIRGAMAPQLQALGVNRRDNANPDEYDHFTGALQEQLQLWQEDHGGKQPSYEEVIDKIAPSVLNTQTTKKGWFYNSQVPAFEQWNRPKPEDIPKEFREKVTADVIAKGGAEPTENQLLNAYVRQQFIQLYGGSSSGGPSAPQSK